MDVDLTRRVVSIGTMYRIGTDIFFRHWLLVLLVAIYVVVPASVSQELLFRTWNVDPEGTRNIGYGLLAMMVHSVIMLLADVFMIMLAERALRGDMPDAAQLAFRSVRYFPVALLVLAAYSIIVLIGLMLFIVPGLYWLVSFNFVLYFIVLEDSGFSRAFNGSRDLARGHFWKVLGVIIALWCPGMVISSVLGMVGPSYVVALFDGIYSLFAIVMETAFFLNVRTVWNIDASQDSHDADTIGQQSQAPTQG